MNHNSLTTNIYYLEVKLVHVSTNHRSEILTTDLSQTRIQQKCLIVLESPLVLDSKNSAGCKLTLHFFSTKIGSFAHPLTFRILFEEKQKDLKIRSFKNTESKVKMF